MNNQPPEEQDGATPEKAPAALDKMKEGYQSLDDFLKIREGESWPLIVLKIGLRVLALIVLIALSPIILLVLIIAFFAAL